MGDQQQVGIGGGLLQHFQQCIGRTDIHVLRRCDNHDLAQAETGSSAGELHQLADLLNFDDPAFALWLKPLEVAVITARTKLAGVALTAIEPADGPRAQQQSGQRQRQAGFARVLRPGQQQCVGQLPPGQLLVEPQPGLGLPGQWRTDLRNAH